MAECVCLRLLLALTDPIMDRENACLTFLTPSTFHPSIFHVSHVSYDRVALLSGDRALVDVIAHGE